MSHTVLMTWVMDWTYVVVCLSFLMSLLASVIKEDRWDPLRVLLQASE